MWPDQVSNPGPLTYESGALLIALRGPAEWQIEQATKQTILLFNVGILCDVIPVWSLNSDELLYAVKLLSTEIDRYAQTVQIQIRLL